MMAPFNLERAVWENIKNKNDEYLLELFTSKLTTVYDGKRMSGEKIVAELNEIEIENFSIGQLEVVMSENYFEKDIDDETRIEEIGVHQTYYVLELSIRENTNQILKRKYSISSTWKRTGEIYTLKFAMIQSVL